RRRRGGHRPVDRRHFSRRFALRHDHRPGPDSWPEPSARHGVFLFGQHPHHAAETAVSAAAATPPVQENWPMVITATIVSAIVSFIAVKWLLRFVQTHTFIGFGWYRVAVGAALLAALAAHVIHSTP